MPSPNPYPSYHHHTSMPPTQRPHESCLVGGGNVELDPANRFRLSTVERSIRGCPDRYMVTLTTKRRLDEIQMSREVSETLHRVNATLFGTHYSRKKTVRLATLAMQERSIDQGLHTHILVGVPEGSLALKANPCRQPVSDLILNTWVSLDDRFKRTANAQDARDIYDFDGARRYVMKTMTSLEALDRADWLNTTSSDA